MISTDTNRNAQPSKSFCIIFLCDEGYLFPTLVCAKQARRYAPQDTDIIIMVDMAGLDDARRARLERASGASIRLVPPAVTQLLDKSVPNGFFARTHINRACLFRLFIAQLVDARYDRILYLDGDMQIRHPLTELFGTHLPDGHVGAVPDWMAFHLSEGMPFAERNRAYFTALGLPETSWSSYFNSGMVMATPATWKDVGAAALDFLVTNPEACLFHDQSALNHVCYSRTTSLSVRWNYMRSFMSLPAYREIDPAIVHFVGRLKPWDGSYAPWGRTEFEPYLEMARTLTEGDATWRRQPFVKRLAYRFRPFFKKDDYADPMYRSKIDRSLRASLNSAA